MDRLRIGRSLRTIRVRLGWRQQDLGDRAGLSRSFISKIERGHLLDIGLGALERVSVELGADLDVRVRWRGEGLDRLLDEAHATLVNRVVRELDAAHWETAVEVTFNEYGDRGSVDVLGWHRETRSVLVVEVKSVVPDAQATLMPLDRKARLGRKIGALRGWDALSVSRMLVVADRPINRRRIAALSAMFETALPARNVAIRRWLRAPIGQLSGLWFLSDSPSSSTGASCVDRLRVNRPRAPGKSLG